LKRLRHLDPETGQECTPEQQEEFEEQLLKMFYRLLRETEQKGEFSLEIKDDTTQHEEPQTFEKFVERRTVEKKFRVKVDDHWTVDVDPDQIRDSLVRNHDDGEWYRKVPFYWVASNYDGANVLVLSMVCLDGMRVYQFTQSYKRPTDS